MPKSAAPSILDKSYTITAEVTIPEGGAEGMIVTEGGRFGGYGLFLSKGEFGFNRGKVVFLYNLLDLKRTTWEGPELGTLIAPSLVGRLLFGEGLNGIATPIARLTWSALIALGVACWPGPPLVGMLTYSVLVTLYLAYVGFAGGLTGVLLWPAIALHVVLSFFLRSGLARQ